MTRFRITVVVFWCCWWSSLLCQSNRLGVKCATEELEDFPLDANGNADRDYDQETTIDLSTFDQRNSSSDNADDVNSNDETSSTAADRRIVTFNKMMSLAMKEPAVKPSLGQVLPIIRAMSPTQRLTLATLVLRQLTSPSSSSPLPRLEQFSNKSVELMLPISADIAAMLQSLKKNAESGRSTPFGTYYYNPLSAGYKVNNAAAAAQHPIFYNIRRRLQASAGNRKSSDDVPPEMMPPPFVPSSNVSYAEFNEHKIQSASEHDDDDEEDDDADEDENKSEDVSDEHRRVQYPAETGHYVNETAVAANAADLEDEQCDTLDDRTCYKHDEMHLSYPSENIVKSIKNLERKRVFGALVQDFVHDAVSEGNPEIQRRFGSVGSAGSTTTPIKDKENTLQIQLCASKIKYARPKKAKSTNGNWKFIVNTDHYTQTVRIETCLNADKSCSFLNENVKSHCVQMYNYHRLLTWDEKSGLSLDLFKIPTCCSCQIQQVNVFSPQTTKNSRKPDVELLDNVIVDQSNVVYTPPIKPKTKHKLNLTPLPSTPYNTLKRESLWVTKTRRPLAPQQPAILPLQHLDGGANAAGGGGGISRYPASENAIRRTSSKTNILKGVYVPGKGTLIEHSAEEPESTTSTFPRRVNYNYHPIIDFFRSTPTSSAAAASAAAQTVDRADTVADEWLPMTEGPRSIKTR